MGPIVPKTIVVISKPDLDHIMYDHVWVTDETAAESNKNIFDKNWLRTWDIDLRAAIGKIADFVLEAGERGETGGAAEENTFDYYFNFNTQTGWNADGSRFKGVIIRGQQTALTFSVRTMFPKGYIK